MIGEDQNHLEDENQNTSQSLFVIHCVSSWLTPPNIKMTETKLASQEHLNIQRLKAKTKQDKTDQITAYMKNNMLAVRIKCHRWHWCWRSLQLE